MNLPVRVVLLLLAGVVALAQAAGPAAPVMDPPRLAVEPKGRVLLGSVGPTQVSTLNYSISNQSSAPISLRLADLAPGLKAWGPALERPFGPGEKLSLTLTIDPTDFVGPQARSVRLITDDPHQGEYRLPVAMDVRADLTVDALRKDLGNIAPNESPQATFTFTRETGRPTAIHLTSALPAYLEPEIVSAGAVTRLLLTFRQDRVPAGATLGLETLEVASNAPQQPRFTLYLEWKLRHPLEALPSRLVMLDPAQTTLDLRLRARDGKPFLLAEARVEGGGFTVAALPVEAKAEQLLRISRSAQVLTRSLLVLRVQGQDEPLKVPLAYLPPN